MEGQIDTLTKTLMNGSNDERKAAEESMKNTRQNDAQSLLGALVAFINATGKDADQTKQQQACLAAILLKKQYLDDRAEEKDFWQVSNEDIAKIKDEVSAGIEFVAHSNKLLARKADIICKCYAKLGDMYSEMIANLVGLMTAGPTPEEETKRKGFALYNFEILAEYHLSQELITENSKQFLDIFAASLEDEKIEVKVASLKAITNFLSSIDDTSVVLKYKTLAEKLLSVVIEVLNKDEEKGRASLDSMIELTSTHSDIWQGQVSMLINVASQIMKNREFDQETRTSALEIMATLAEQMATLLRKSSDDLKNHLVPAIAYMMTEVDLADDLDGWLAEEELEMQAKQDPANVAAETIQRISVHLGEKTTLATMTDIIKAAIQSADWKEQWMGFKFLGMISEACNKSFSKNLTEIAQMSASGIVNENPRVRFEAMQCTALLIQDLSPNFQMKFHGELVPVLVRLMKEESHLKMQTQAVCVLTAFISGLIDQESAEDSEQNEKNKKVLLPYVDQLVECIGMLFSKSIEQNYRPLQEEILASLSCLASLLDKNFEQHYSSFMPGLINILQTVKSETD